MALRTQYRFSEKGQRQARGALPPRRGAHESQVGPLGEKVHDVTALTTGDDQPGIGGATSDRRADRRGVARVLRGKRYVRLGILSNNRGYQMAWRALWTGGHDPRPAEVLWTGATSDGVKDRSSHHSDRLHSLITHRPVRCEPE